VDADGLLNVSAREMTQGVEAAITVKPSYGLSDSDIMRMLQDSSLHAQEDMQARALREQQVEAEQLLEAVGNALEQDAALLDKAGLARIRAGMDALRSALQTSSDHNVIKRGITQLNELTLSFAQARMDKNVARALGGKKLIDLTH
jgi:molecular chaperone HscA